MVLKSISELLQYLTEKYPPPDNCKHSITLSDDFGETVCLNIYYKNAVLNFKFDKEDLVEDVGFIKEYISVFFMVNDENIDSVPF